MSTPNLQGEAAYRYESVYAIFPKRIVEAAGGKVQQVAFQIDSRTAYATGRRETAHILREARCRIPDTEAAKRIVRKRLEQFPSPHSLTKSESSKKVVWSGTRSKMCDSRRNGTQEKDLQCVEWTATFDCYTDCDDPDPPQNPPPDECNTTCVKSWECSRTVYVAEDPLDGGGCYTGCGDDPSGCNADGGATGQLCESGGGAVEPEADTIRSPCRTADNPPDYCDEAGSCADANIGNNEHKGILASLESRGAIVDRWRDTNAGASNQDDRAEKNSFIIRENGNYRTEPFSEYGNITTTSCTIRGNVSVPPNAVGMIHFQPFSDGERVTSRECLEAQDFANPDRFLGPDANYTVDYDSEPSDADISMAEQYDLDTYVMDKDSITVVSKEGATEGAYSRCGY